MAFADYEKALKLGQKLYREHVSRGHYPYLPVLDEILTSVEIETRTSLGLVDIPLELIVGTSTEGRTQAFASNFMPLLDVKSEFALKWATLYDALVAEGQRDPITAYEFMGRFYVIEGNKRVSVSKYLGTFSVSGTVTRLIPKASDQPENIIYREFLEFYRLTSINYVWFSTPGSYEHLLRKAAEESANKVVFGEPWGDEQRAEFRAIWIAFGKEYEALGGRQLNCTQADAQLIYMDLFGARSLLEDPPAVIRRNITKIWDEFRLVKKQDSVSLLMVPKEAPQKNLIEKILAPEPEHIKVGFVHNKTAETSAWTYGHELGRRHLEQAFGDHIETVCIDNVEPENAYEAIEQEIKAGCTVIFTTTPSFIHQSLKAAVHYPKIRILNCSLNVAHRYVRTYYSRMYEAKFLSGVLAGILTENNRVGYLADYPIFGSTANINAFALGAKMVNRHVKVFLDWSTIKDHNPDDTFLKNQVMVISNKDLITPSSKTRDFGLYVGNKGPKLQLAMPIWHWGNFYEQLIRNIMSGAWSLDDDTTDLQAINYWWGMSAGVIDLIYSEQVPPQTRHLLEILKQSLISNTFVPFIGPIYDQDGTLRCEKDRLISPEEVTTMDWLVDNVIGSIPAADTLVKDASIMAHFFGVSPEDEHR